MAEKRVVLITGVAGYWGSKLVAHLLSPTGEISGPETDDEKTYFGGYQVLGLDIEPPEEEIKGLDFIQADIRNPLLSELIRSEQVHTVVHLAFLESQRPSEKAFDHNVIGTMKVLGACAEAGVKKVVLRSSIGVYGSAPTNPAFITENQPLNGSKTDGIASNLVEIESFLNGFTRQSPEMVVSILRFANIIGPSVDSPFTRFLNLHPPVTLFGFDPLMQIIHEEDVIRALLFAIQNDVPGAYNLAAEGILPLGKILGLGGKFPLPVIHWGAYWGTSIMKRLGLKPEEYFPLEPDALRYPCVVDLTRMHEEMKFVPAYTAEEALREFSGALRMQKYKADTIDMAYDEERLRDTIERRRRKRTGQPLASVDEGGEL